MNPQIVVIVKGGVVQSVYGSQLCDVEVIDYDDILEEGEGEYPPVEEVTENMVPLW